MKNRSEKNHVKVASLFFLGAILLISAGCHKDQVQVYRVATDQDQSAQQALPLTNSSTLPPGHPDVSTMGTASGQMPAGVVASDVQNAPPLKWTTPAGWTEVPPSEMRVASFKVPGPNGTTADVSVVPLPGMAGGDFANVNRWRGQVGLPPAADDVLQNSAENIEAGGQPGQLFDIGGSSSRILGVIQHRDGTAWFYKMTGDPSQVEQQKPAFIAFLKSLIFQPSAAASSAGQPSMGDMGAPAGTALPPGHPDVANMSPAAAGPVSHDGQPNWDVPAGWKEVAAGQFLVAKFLLSDAKGAAAAVNVSASGGDGGGLAPNVNRWRGQLGLPPADEISTVTFAVPGGEAQLVDLTGKSAETSEPTELIGIVVTQPDRTWFYKLMGAPAVVAAQKDAFTQFVKGAKY